MLLPKCILAIGVVLPLLRAQQDCDPKLCNNEGLCKSLGNNQRTCECIGTTYFQGEDCSEMVDNCASNPCKNGATCTNAVGQYFCEPCPDGFGGQKCAMAKPNVFTKCHLLFNRHGVYAQEHSFFMSVETLGSALFTYELTTTTISIEALETNPATAIRKMYWQWSDNLAAVAGSLGLRNAKNLPYQSGYYHVSRTHFWSIGTQTITMLMYDTATGMQIYAEQEHTLEIRPAKDVPCVPEVTFEHCSNPKKPLFIDIASYNNFEPVMMKRCANGSAIKYRWFIFNTLESVQLYDFKHADSLLLKVPPFRLWFNYYGSVMQSYVVRLEASEITTNRRLRTVARCFIFVMSKRVRAIIRGGRRRNVAATKSFELDGSQSRDYALSPSEPQDMNYRWDCSSENNNDNNYCRDNIGQGKVLPVRAGLLKLEMSYVFTLAVTSKVNIFSTHNATQEVNIVPDTPLYVTINCVRNCQQLEFTPDKLVHLHAECFDCTVSTNSAYEWTVGGKVHGNTTQRLLYTPTTAEQSLDIAVVLNNGGRTGQATILLRANQPPQGGACNIKPASGVEYETEFVVACSSFEDTPLPLYYQISAEGLMISRTNDAVTHCRLPQTQAVKVLVCDNLRSCTHRTLAVSVTPMAVPQTLPALKELFAKDNLKAMLKDGYMEQAMILTSALTKHVSSLSLAESVMEQLKDTKLRTMLAVEQISEITKNLVVPLKPLDNKKAALLSKFLAKLSDGLRTVVEDAEIHELPTEPYNHLTDNLADLMSEFAAHVEELPETQIVQPQSISFANPIAESYPDFGVFDTTVLTEVNDWLRAARELSKCFNLIGVAAVFQHEPTEIPLEIIRPGFKMQVFSVESIADSQLLQTKENLANISITPATLADLQSELKSPQILLQVVLIDNNPFWWYPDDQPLSTGVVSFSAFSRSTGPNPDINLKNPIDFQIKLQAVGNVTLPPTNGSLTGPLDMPMFSIAMPMNSILIIRFVQVTADLRLMLQLRKKPHGIQVLKSHQIAREGTSFMVINNEGHNSNAYLGLMAAKTNSSTVLFEFTQELHECLSWNYSMADPQWTTVGCRPTLADASGQSIHCRCHHLSTFAGRLHHTSAAPVLDDQRILQFLPINWNMVLVYLLFAMILGYLIALGRSNYRQTKERLIVELMNQDLLKEFNILLRITTGNYWNAGTTANVSVAFFTCHGKRNFVIHQNPENPQLVQNSTCSLSLPLSGDALCVPLRLVLSRDNNGRYPSWYCATISVEDIQKRYKHTFEVNRWITTEPFLLIATKHAAPPKFGPAMETEFKQTLERICIQWFQFQPLCGPWQNATMDLSRLERTCIWVCKISITTCIIACYFGTTTLDTYEDERAQYNSIIFDTISVLSLCVLCYAVVLLVDLVFKVLLKYNQ